MKRFLPFACIFIASTTIAQPARKTVDESIETLQKDIPVWMNNADIPGMQAILIRNGKQAWLKSYGVANAETKTPVDNNTLFEAASLSKVITAYAALKLVDQGKLDLDIPLNTYLGNNYDIGDDERIRLITARLVLTHSAGFPNWRNEGSPTLPIEFTPGEKFSYSGEGFVYLSKVMEKLTAMDFETYVQESVFQPLGMTNSFFSWQDSFAYRHVYRHNWEGKKIFPLGGERI
jgi:CubicO group peptidase (beta-lactamase class C family)